MELEISILFFSKNFVGAFTGLHTFRSHLLHEKNIKVSQKDLLDIFRDIPEWRMSIGTLILNGIKVVLFDLMAFNFFNAIIFQLKNQLIFHNLFLTVTVAHH